jgi:hypothetical protein
MQAQIQVVNGRESFFEVRRSFLFCSLHFIYINIEINIRLCIYMIFAVDLTSIGLLFGVENGGLLVNLRSL